MAGYSARASTYTTGDTISAADTNDEFDTILTAFGTSGHVHDGSAGNGGNVTALRGHALTFGLGTAGTDVVITFDGETGDGVFSWMEDEDYFKFSDDLMIVDNESLIFGSDSNILIQYDETTTDSLRISAAEGAGLAITLAADEGDDAGDEWKVNIADGGVMTWGNDKNSAGTYVTHVTLTPHATVASSTVAFAGGVTVAGDLTITGDDLTMGTNTSGFIMVADGTNFNPVAVSGDVTMASNGAVTIANQAVENAMLADDAVGADELAANAVVDASVASGAAIAVSKTALTAGTNISLSTNTLNVDDAFLINSGDDTTSGVVTSAGYKLNVGAGSGDVTTQFQQGGTTLFAVGIDDSDSEKFKIHSSTALADTSDFEITSAGVVSLASDLNVGGDLVVTGDFTVNGDTTTVNTATLSVEDPLIIMASGNNSADSVDIGFYGLYDTSGSQDLYSGLFRDANDSGKWKLFKDLQVAPTTTVNVSGTGYATGSLVANLEGNVTGNASGTAATVTGAAQSNITSLGTLTTLTVDSVIINGTNIGHTSDTDAMAISSGGVVTFSQVPLFPNDTIETADIQADAITGAKIADDALDSEHYTDGSIDLAHVATAAKTECIAIACSDETTALATATAQATFHMPYAFYLTGVKAGLTTAPVGSVFTVDINEAGSTILTTKLTIDASEKTSGTAATAAVIGGAGPALAADALMTVDIDGVGSSTAGTGLKVYLIGYQT
jgi:hypothetical protein|tara:strand:- start:1270 stop:3456 length:2187 start_codon:yes stop_codon:yes gene_type:complete